MQAHTSPPKVATVGSAHHGICPRGIPGHRGRYRTGPRGSSGKWEARPSYPVSPQVSPGCAAEGGRGEGALGDNERSLCLGRCGADFRDSFYGTFGSPGCWAPPCQGQEDFGGLLSSSRANPRDPSQSLNRAQGCRCGREVAARRQCGLTHQQWGFAHAAARVHVRPARDFDGLHKSYHGNP